MPHPTLPQHTEVRTYVYIILPGLGKLSSNRLVRSRMKARITGFPLVRVRHTSQTKDDDAKEEKAEGQEASSILGTIILHTWHRQVHEMANRATTRTAKGFLLVLTTAALTAKAFSTTDIVQNRGSNSIIQTECQPWRASSTNQRIARQRYSSSSSLQQTRRPGNPITGLFSDMASSISSSLSGNGKPNFNVEALD